MSGILIVSADAAASAQARAALPGEMYDLVVEADANGALERAASEEETIDLILLDRGLVVGDGRLLERFLDRARNHDIPLLVLGPATDTGDWSALLHAGASAYVTTPIDADGLAARIAVFLRTKERIDQLRDQAVIDELTGVYNRRYLDGQLSTRMGEAKRYDTPFTVGLLDIDHFKAVNDQYGHQVGDLVLAETAALVRRQMRKEDLLARYGGEEFAVLLPHTDRLGAAILAERVREAVAEYSFVADPATTVRITISMGLASYPLDNSETGEHLLRLADGRLYEAKVAGRNQTVFE